MALNLVNLNDAVRQSMLEEIDLDLSQNRLYKSARLNDGREQDYVNFLREAVQKSDDSWLASQISANGLLKQMELRNGKPVKVAVNAHETLAEGEFNRFYIRGLCAYAIKSGIPNVKVYRARFSANPRPESQAKIATLVAAKQLLDDLRINIGVDTVLGLPQGPNSGLSACLP